MTAFTGGDETASAWPAEARELIDRAQSDDASRPEARSSILENGSPGMRSAGMPRAGSKDVAFDHRLIASPLARNSPACS
jgi:hypothetical protein